MIVEQTVFLIKLNDNNLNLVPTPQLSFILQCMYCTGLPKKNDVFPKMRNIHDEFSLFENIDFETFITRTYFFGKPLFKIPK